MLTIRFARMGKKNKAQFQIVLQEHTVAPGGRHIEVLGSYDPHSKQAVLKEEKIKEWIGKGAQLSDTVHNLLLAKGIVAGEKRKVKMPARNASPSENTGENLSQAKTSEESTDVKKHSAAGGPKKAEEQKPEEAAEAKPEENLPSEIPSEAGSGEAAISQGKEEVKNEEKVEAKTETPKEEAKKA